MSGLSVPARMCLTASLSGRLWFKLLVFSAISRCVFAPSALEMRVSCKGLEAGAKRCSTERKSLSLFLTR